MQMKEQLLRILKSASAPLSAKELAKMLNCTERHARRLIHKLRDMGYPISKVRHGKYILEGISNIKNAIFSVNLSEQQLLVLLMSLYMTMLSLRNTPLYSQIVEVIKRLRKEMNPEIVYVLPENPILDFHFFNQSPGPSFDPDVFFNVLKAILHEKKIRVQVRPPGCDYTVDEEVDPITLALMSAVPVLLVFDPKRETIRPLPLSMIQKLEVLEKGFTPPQINPGQLENMLAPDAMYGAKVENSFEVRIRVDRRFYDAMAMTNLVPEQRREQRGGHYFLILPFNSVVHAIGVCLGIAHVGMIEEPVWLREAIGYILHQTAKVYPQPTDPPNIPTGLPVLVPVMNLIDRYYPPPNNH